MNKSMTAEIKDQIQAMGPCEGINGNDPIVEEGNKIIRNNDRLMLRVKLIDLYIQDIERKGIVA
jgi:hypothetical protein